MIGDRGFGLLTFRLTVSPPFSSVVDATGTTQSELAPELAGSVAAAFIPELYRFVIFETLRVCSMKSWNNSIRILINVTHLNVSVRGGWEPCLPENANRVRT
ncbi:unnamed protein product [Brassica oleracea var. botrytis]|uniref:(rape) hypothetical protein n=1 Tax=Brassica napus TaxID=3708 RepID=A0A816INJ5_BRANA|nr:unnamed protein product [Brassica napus]